METEFLECAVLGRVRLQKGMGKFGQHVHKQAKGVGKDVASSIPNPRVGAGSRREHPAEDGLMVSQAHVQKAELEGPWSDPDTFPLLLPWLQQLHSETLHSSS